MLTCADGTYYTGYTHDLGKRLARHNNGLASKYTRARLPVAIVWQKGYKSKRAAMSAEGRIKRFKRKDKECLINGARLDNVERKYKK